MQHRYLEKIMDNEMKKVILSEEKGLRNKSMKGILFVVAYQPHLLTQLAERIEKYFLHVAYEF